MNKGEPDAPVNRLEVPSFVVMEKSLPSWMRNHSLKVLVSEFIPHWGGPEPKGFVCLFAQSWHEGSTLDSPGHSLWILGPDDGRPDPFTPERWSEGASYIMERIRRRAHQPKECLMNLIVIAAPPGVN